MIEKIRQKCEKNFNLSDEQEGLLSEILSDVMNLDRCNDIIDTIATLRLGNDALISFVGYQLFKVDPVKGDEIAKKFNEEELSMYNSFKIIKDVSNLPRNEEAEDIRKMFLGLSKDLRVVIIKLAGVLYDIKHIEPPFDEQKRAFIHNVKDIFAPLAERLGLGEMKSCMEDYCFKYQNPIEYNELLKNVMLKKEDNDKQIAITNRRLYEILQELNIKGEVTYRQKHLSSIFKKIQTKNVTLGQIFDLIAMRVLVNTVEECYAVFGKIHSIYTPMQGRVKDYIANPKPNGYKSLHTTIIVENQRPMEIQIRTYDMHRDCEFGIAAHWIYKEKRIKTSNLDKKLSWFREIMDNAQDLPIEEFIATLKTELYDREIFVQTPKGKVIQLPEGATILDFAYAIHSDVGNYCVGGKINGGIKPIVTQLKNGDVVEIITSSTSKGPSRDWLTVVKTAPARSKIKAFFKAELKEENILIGHTMLNEAIQQKGFTESQLCSGEIFEETLRKCNVSTKEELYASIGSGSLNVTQVVGRLITFYSKEQNVVQKPIQSIKVKRSDNGITIDGTTGMMIRYAGCCNPIVGDDIIGYISHGRGVTIHRKSCPNCKYLEEDRFINAEWEEKAGSEFVAVIKLVADKSSSNISRITSVLNDLKISIKAFESKDTEDDFVSAIAIAVKNKNQLDKAMQALEGIKGMKKVFRGE